VNAIKDREGSALQAPVMDVGIRVASDLG
jgi:hypothetical protein